MKGIVTADAICVKVILPRERALVALTDDATEGCVITFEVM